MKNSTKGQMKRTRRGPEGPAIPVSTTPTNVRGDQLCMLMLAGLLVLSVAVLGGGLYYGITGFHASFIHAPIDYLGCLGWFLLIALSILVARGIASLSFFGTVALGTRFGAWQTVEAIGSKSAQLKRVLPGGTAWLSTAYVQSICNRGLYKEAIAAAQAEWDRSSKDPKQYQHLGTICFTGGIACQGLGDVKQAHAWNEKALDILNKCSEELAKPPKGMVAKAMKPQTEQAAGQLKMQLAATYFNVATHYFNMQDYRRAKENYRLALENAKKSPDFPQKAEMIKFGGEQMARLKHS
jgi:tetratricopeptide (TPR) repeat protein